MEEKEVKKTTLQLEVQLPCDEGWSVWLHRDDKPIYWFSSWIAAWDAQRVLAKELNKEGYDVKILEMKEATDGTND